MSVHLYRIHVRVLIQFHDSVVTLVELRVKKQAQDRPMSLWISSIKQLEPVRHLLSPLLLDFMEAAWPSSISMVIPRGRAAFILEPIILESQSLRVFLFWPRPVDGHVWFRRCCQTHRDATKHCYQEPRLHRGHTSHEPGRKIINCNYSEPSQWVL